MAKIKTNHILIFIIVLLLIAGAISILRPIRFENQYLKREAIVKERLTKIRLAEEAYLKTHGAYTDNLKLLVKEGFLADSLRFVPFSDGKQFTIATTMYVSKSKRQIPLMECGTTYDEYLLGLGKSGISELIEKATSSGKYPGLKIGDLTIPNDNAGNWE